MENERQTGAVVSKWRVVEGFGDVEDRANCWDVEEVTEMPTQLLAEQFAEDHYDNAKERGRRKKSYWVIAEEVK
jgi:hypothetical protein